MTEAEAIVALVGAAAARIGEPIVRAVAVKLAELVGASVLRGHIDVWEAARAASDLAFQEKFGESP